MATYHVGWRRHSRKPSRIPTLCYSCFVAAIRASVLPNDPAQEVCDQQTFRAAKRNRRQATNTAILRPAQKAGLAEFRRAVHRSTVAQRQRIRDRVRM